MKSQSTQLFISFLTVTLLSLNLFAKTVSIDIPEDYFPNITGVGNPDGSISFTNIETIFDNQIYPLVGYENTAKKACKKLHMKYVSYEIIPDTMKLRLLI